MYAAFTHALLNSIQAWNWLNIVIIRAKGQAVISGLRHARKLGFSHALQLDSDGQHDWQDVGKISANFPATPGRNGHRSAGF